MTVLDLQKWSFFFRGELFCKTGTCDNLGNTYYSIHDAALWEDRALVVCAGCFLVLFHKVLEETGDFSKEIVHLKLNEREGRHLGLPCWKSQLLWHPIIISWESLFEKPTQYNLSTN